MQTTVVPHFRVARPSANLAAATRFYVDGLGLEVLATFRDHDGFDGVVLGHAGWPYHLEFTRRVSRAVAPAPTDEDLLVLYVPESGAWQRTVERLLAAGARAVPASNPYWEAHGITFEDPDGYRLVVQRERWEPDGALSTPSSRRAAAAGDRDGAGAHGEVRARRRRSGARAAEGA